MDIISPGDFHNWDTKCVHDDTVAASEYALAIVNARRGSRGTGRTDLVDNLHQMIGITADVLQQVIRQRDETKYRMDIRKVMHETFDRALRLLSSNTVSIYVMHMQSMKYHDLVSKALLQMICHLLSIAGLETCQARNVNAWRAWLLD